MRIKLAIGIITIMLIQTVDLYAWEGMSMPRLHVEGRYLKDPHGNIINLHGFAQTYSPWFNERGAYWDNYNVAGCLTYNQNKIDEILDAGWKMNFVRIHMDPYWSSTPGCEGRYEGEECFNEDRFIKYLDEVFVPMTEYAVSKGLYVVLRPPGVAPEEIEVGGVYYNYLLQVWGIVSEHPVLKNHPNVSFELANEPIRILGPDGTYGSGTQGHFDNLKIYFQDIVDSIRVSADNILWIPGLGYQSQYSGFAVNPIEGEDIGYAVHVYPGWFNSGQGYEPFQRGWDEQVKPVADFAPIIITEMDWAPEKYDASWGTDITGTAGGEGFGANFKLITDKSENVSWLLFTEPHFLADFTGISPAQGQPYTFLNDPEACPWPIYHWYQDYAEEYNPRPEFQYQTHTDNGDGTFANPLIHADFPSPLVVEKEGKYFLASVNTAFQRDTTLLESKDLVSWEYSNANLSEISFDEVQLVNNTDPASGSLIETNTGEWWVVKSFSEGAYGSFPYLLPVSWDGDTPVLDETAKESSALTKPDIGREFFEESVQTNDNFRNYLLSPQWHWKDMPIADKWSLLERAGFLRLYSGDAVNDIDAAQNVLSQRVTAFRSDLSRSFATIRLELGAMQDGEIVGLSLYGDEVNMVGVTMSNGEKHVVSHLEGQMATQVPITGSEIYLRILASYNSSKAYLYYSFDNSQFTQVGATISLNETPSSGYRFGITSYATQQSDGYVDLDWFSTESTYSEERFYPADFESFTEASLTLTGIESDQGEDITILSGGTTKINVTAYFEDGHSEDVSRTAIYTNYDSEIITVRNGNITSIKDGESALEIIFEGPLGNKQQINATVVSSTFPLTNELFNADIWEDGTFDETTNTLHTGLYGFGGWQYDAIDLSEYKYIVVRLGGGNNTDAQFRLFDESSYWSSPANYPMTSNEVIIDLQNATKDDGTPLDPSHIYIAGFWTNGSNPFVIDTVYLTNTTEYDPPTILVQSTDESEVSSLNNFEYEFGEGPSAPQSFQISGYNLTADIELSASSDYEISIDEEGGYSSKLMVPNLNGDAILTTVYARLMSGLSRQYYQGEITMTSSGAEDQSIILTGRVKGIITGLPEPEYKVISATYYTLTGRRLSVLDQAKGVVIVRKFYSDGTISTDKILLIDQ